jgi:cyclic pyranopterin phosphate synthase
MTTDLLADSFGRCVRTVRVSLTDHCNFRCVYCMPPEGLPYLDKSKYLTAAEIARFVRVASALGVTHCRLTGGEPLLRRDVVDIVRMLKDIDTLHEVSMTTNGSLLPRLAGPLRHAGLDRLNISLDSLDPARFEEVTLVSQHDRVMDGIDAARAVGFPMKINVVAISGMRDDEVFDFVQLAIDHDTDVRFLEFMPLCGSGWEADRVYPIAAVRRLVASRYALHELPRGDRPAQLFSIEGGRGRVGFIASLSEPFCSDCSRMRLTADGRIRPCLFSDVEHPIAALLRGDADDNEVAAAIRAAVWKKPWGSEFSGTPFKKGESTKRRTTEAPLIRTLGG